MLRNVETKGRSNSKERKAGQRLLFSYKLLTIELNETLIRLVIFHLIFKFKMFRDYLPMSSNNSLQL